MLSQPRGRGSKSSNQQRLLLAVTFLLIPFLQTVDASQSQQLRARALQHPDNPGSPLPQSDTHIAVTNIRDEPVLQTSTTYWKSTHIIDQPHAAERDQTRRKRSEVPPGSKHNIGKKHNQINIPTDASALATFAPAHAVRAPNPSRHPRSNSVPTAGLATPHVARSLEDWEVEDFVLLATVDGDLYASDRKTLKERWHLEVDQPMIETKHHRSNTSVLDEDYSPIDHYIWAVEPTRDGGIYVWMPGSDSGLFRTTFTMKRLVEELAPFADEEPAVVYTGDKKTTLITLDAATGKILKWFGSGGSHINQAESCLRPNTLYNMDQTECSSTGTITLGRTEYTVGIQRRDGRPIATLKYSEWGPNNYDNDLLHQYHSSLDSRYFTSQHDGNVYAFDPPTQLKPATHEKFSSPVARVFDVCRPWDAPAGSNPELVVLPQPPMPSHDEDIARIRSQSIFLNRTDTGSWYALSGRAYPLIIDAPVARVSENDWFDLPPVGENHDSSYITKSLVGTHHLGHSTRAESYQPTLPQSISAGYDSDGKDSLGDLVVSDVSDDVGIIDKVKTLPQSAANSVIDLVRNPALIFVVIIVLILNERKIRRSYHQFKEHDMFRDPHAWVTGRASKASNDNDSKDDSKYEEEMPPTQEPLPAQDHVVTNDQPTFNDKNENQQENVQEDEKEKEDESKAKAVLSGSESSSSSSSSPISKQIEASGNELEEKQPTVVLPPPDAPDNGTNAESPQKKKKAHRGRRGGVKHRKQPKSADASSQPQNQSEEKGRSDGMEHTMRTTSKIVGNDGKERLEPDVLTVSPNDMQAINSPIVNMGGIEVNGDERLGSGSNGTVVFAGKFDGRDVAVKRMLIDFYDIALRETKLLRESDDHPNVIRYYAQQIQDGFLYIALERCAASLADVVDRPHLFRDLANAGNRDLPGVLHQITTGLSHLHSLRIVHRDIKPQNILVNMGKDGKPRLLVSDFGLCKKLEGGQSSFGASTEKAAGTTGWRAPELLLDDDAHDSGALDATSNTHEGSGSVLVMDVSNASPRRATRSIDIFALGLVFFYVLTGGGHPFNCGNKYMREANIRAGRFDLEPLELLGDYGYEAKHLIRSMISANPKDRPTAYRVMAHPFFWSAKKRLAFLCDVSDHFEKEPREPPSDALRELESHALEVTNGDFLRKLPREFTDSLGKQRKYTASRLLDLLRALRNKRNHYEDMPESLKRTVGGLPDGYLHFWTTKFPNLLLTCYNVVISVGWEETNRFNEYYEPARL